MYVPTLWILSKFRRRTGRRGSISNRCRTTLASSCSDTEPARRSSARSNGCCSRCHGGRYIGRPRRAALPSRRAQVACPRGAARRCMARGRCAPASRASRGCAADQRRAFVGGAGRVPDLRRDRRGRRALPGVSRAPSRKAREVPAGRARRGRGPRAGRPGPERPVRNADGRLKSRHRGRQWQPFSQVGSGRRQRRRHGVAAANLESRLDQLGDGLEGRVEACARDAADAGGGRARIGVLGNLGPGVVSRADSGERV